jgi:regulator of PEP synthase PpsR (kinase-PPPase family)
VGKTPVSLYLAVLGWKVANIPFVPQIPISEKLFALDPERVFGLTIEAGQLIHHRRQRQRQLGVSGPSDYMDPGAVQEEIREALRLFRRAGFSILDMTDKTIEAGADEIIRHLPPAQP